MKKISKALAPVLCLMFLFAVCGTAIGSVAAGGETKVVEVWVGDWWAPEKEWIERQFAEDNPGWAVNLVLQPVAGYLDSAIAAVASGSGPDVLDLDTLMIPSAIDVGLIMPLDDFMSRNGITADMFVEANYDAGVARGGNYSIPNRNAPISLFYNKTMFDEVGVDYPTDRMALADFVALCRELNEKLGEGRYAFGIAATKTDQANVMTSFGTFLWGAGGDFLNADMTQSAMNTPGSVAGIKTWVELYTVDKVVPEGSIDYAITRDLYPLAQNQSIAMFPLNDNNMANLRSGQADGSIQDFEWGQVLLPGYGRAAGWSFTIPTGTANLEGAELFINWYIKPEVASRNNTVMPAIIEAQSFGRWGEPNLEIFYRQMEYLKNAPPTPKWSDIQMLVIEELQNALTGTITPEQAAANMDAGINALL